MRSIDKKLIVYIILCLLLMLPTLAGAIGQITAPITVKNALREKTYSDKMTIINTENSPSRIKISSEGDIAGWTGFYKGNGEAVEEIELPARAKTEITAKFTVPAGIPNGTYKGYISVLRSGSEEDSGNEESKSSVAQKIDREVTIEVNDIEEIAFDTSVIPEKYDLSQGELLKVRIIHENQGNVEMKPRINLKIKQGDETAYSAIFPYPENETAINPFSLREIHPLEIPTSNLQTGKYRAILTVSQDEKYSIEKEFTFAIGTVKSAGTTSIPFSRMKNLEGVVSALIAVLIAFLIISLKRRIFRKDPNKIRTR